MKIFNAKMVAEALVIGKGYHIFRQTQIGRLWPFGRFFLGGMWKKNENTFRSYRQELHKPQTFGWWAHT